MAVNVPYLLGQRDRVISTLSKYMQFASSNTDSATVEEVDECLDILNKSWSELIQLEDSLVLVPNQQIWRPQFEDQFFRAKTTAKARLRRLNQHQNSTMNNHNESLFECYRGGNAEIRLPRINITPFSGNYSEWPSFCDIFTASIHNNQSLSNIQKFQYLKGYLTGSAEALIRHIPVAEASYDTAWQKLQSRYDNKKHITSSLITLFLNQPPIISATHQNLRKLCDVSDEMIRGLGPLGEHANSRNPWLIYLLLDKVDSETKQLWAQQTESVDSPTVEEFIKFLDSRSSILESCQSISKSPTTNAKLSVKIHHAVSTSNCVKCSSTDHIINQCREFKELNIPERRTFVVAQSLCFNCLRRGHMANTCTSKNSCRTCNKYHHTLLHLNPSTIEPGVTKKPESS